MASTLMLRSTTPLIGKFQYAATSRRARALSRPVSAAKGGDSYQKIEQGARNRQGVESYEERKSETDDFLTSPQANRDTEILGTEVGVADAMRFQGAAPELINSRAAMLGFVLAVVAFSKTQKNIYQQIQGWPVPVFIVFALIAVGTLVPILRGYPRKDFGPFKADAEVVLGRLAMIGIVGLFWLPFVNGFYLYPVNPVVY
ncbi:hypothetical protein ABBQ32_007939 [Trebouxia sp. C0010 RCD-2024]